MLAYYFPTNVAFLRYFLCFYQLFRSSAMDAQLQMKSRDVLTIYQAGLIMRRSCIDLNKLALNLTKRIEILSQGGRRDISSS